LLIDNRDEDERAEFIEELHMPMDPAEVQEQEQQALALQSILYGIAGGAT